METVEFNEADDQMDLPPPMSLSELENMSLAQKRMNALVEPPQEEKPGDVEMDVCIFVIALNDNWFTNKTFDYID